MSLNEQISQSLESLSGLNSAAPRTACWQVEGVATIEADFTAVESLGCAVREFRVSAVAPLAGSATEADDRSELRNWGTRVCERVTYLLEPIHLLEADAEAGTALIRSKPPTAENGRTSYFEAIVSAPGAIVLHRYMRHSHADDRQVVDMQITHEVLRKLVRDVVGAMPAPDAA